MHPYRSPGVRIQAHFSQNWQQSDTGRTSQTCLLSRPVQVTRQKCCRYFRLWKYITRSITVFNTGVPFLHTDVDHKRLDYYQQP